METVFLVYDSRSGSTLLSKNIVMYLDKVFVSPEVCFNHLFKKTNRLKQSEFMYKNYDEFVRKNYINNLFLSKETINKIINKHSNKMDAVSLIKDLFSIYMNQNFFADSQQIILKKGEHLFSWKRINRIFQNNVKYIFMYRDPRAVVNSKLKTKDPYFPYESMAWGGSILASIRWWQYSKVARAAKRNGADMLEISYENFLTSPRTEIGRISSFLSLPFYESKKQSNYFNIPEKEKSIHGLVFSDKFHKDRILAWRSELAKKDIQVIEAITYKEMKLRGYNPENRLSLIKRTAIILLKAPICLGLILRHFFRKFFFKLNKN
jgi:hypothetical protein